MRVEKLKVAHISRYRVPFTLKEEELEHFQVCNVNYRRLLDGTYKLLLGY